METEKLSEEMTLGRKNAGYSRRRKYKPKALGKKYKNIQRLGNVVKQSRLREYLKGLKWQINLKLYFEVLSRERNMIGVVGNWKKYTSRKET